MSVCYFLVYFLTRSWN